MKTTVKIIGATLAAVLSISSIAFAEEVVATSTTTTLGTISEFSPDTIVVRTEAAPEPIRYTYTKTTTYVDEAGQPVSMALVKSGLPVTVYYVKQGDKMVASKVIVRKVKTTTTTDAPVIEKKTTTTTTESK